jgi:uncharacterized protein (TIGR03067 family)
MNSAIAMQGEPTFRTEGAVHTRRYTTQAAFVFLVAVAATRADTPEEEVQRLAGAWGVTSAVQDGKAVAEAEGARMTIAAKEVTDQGKDGTKLHFPFTVDSTTKPRAIDFHSSGGEGWLRIGPLTSIYDLHGDSLKLCISSTGKQPTRFSDQGATLLVLQREEPLPVATFAGHSTEVLALAFLQDGKQVVSVSAKEVRFWHAGSGKESARQAISGFDLGDEPVFAIGPEGPDGPTLALVEWRRRVGVKGFVAHVVLISAKSGKSLLNFDAAGDFDTNYPFGPSFHALAFSPDGKHLVIGGSAAIVGGRHGLPGGMVGIRDSKTGKQLRQLGEVKQWDKNRIDKFIPPDAKVIPGVSTSAGVSSVTFSENGKLIVAGTYGASSELPEAGEVWIWNAADGKLVRMFAVADKVSASGPDYRVSAVALSPDNKRVAAAVAIVRAGGLRRNEHATEVRIWGVASGEVVHTLHGHKGCVTQVAFSPDGKWLASAGSDKVVRLWNARTGKEAVAFPFDTPKINALAFGPDGKFLAAGGGDSNKSGEVRVWECPKE